MPLERDFGWLFKDVRLDELGKQGWPQWQVTQGSCHTLLDLLRRLRNAVAHGHILFSSDSRLLEEVVVEVADFKRGVAEPHWVAHIQGTALRDFCLRLSGFIGERLG